MAGGKVRGHGHGRIEKHLNLVREVFGGFVDLSFDWPRLQMLGVAVSFRQEGDKNSEPMHYYISSTKLTAKGHPSTFAVEQNSCA
jgi:hypothetical protein